MSMFDYVVGFECKCPSCGADVDEFQTKDMTRVMDNIDFRFVDYFYTACPVCSVWITVEIKEETAKKFFEWRQSLNANDFKVESMQLEDKRSEYDAS